MEHNGELSATQSTDGIRPFLHSISSPGPRGTWERARLQQLSLKNRCRPGERGEQRRPRRRRPSRRAIAPGRDAPLLGRRYRELAGLSKLAAVQPRSGPAMLRQPRAGLYKLDSRVSSFVAERWSLRAVCSSRSCLGDFAALPKFRGRRAQGRAISQQRVRRARLTFASATAAVRFQESIGQVPLAAECCLRENEFVDYSLRARAAQRGQILIDQ